LGDRTWRRAVQDADVQAVETSRAGSAHGDYRWAVIALNCKTGDLAGGLSGNVTTAPT
jgi:hypothetical protein